VADIDEVTNEVDVEVLANNVEVEVLVTKPEVEVLVDKLEAEIFTDKLELEVLADKLAVEVDEVSEIEVDEELRGDEMLLIGEVRDDVVERLGVGDRPEATDPVSLDRGLRSEEELPVGISTIGGLGDVDESMEDATVELAVDPWDETPDVTTDVTSVVLAEDVDPDEGLQVGVDATTIPEDEELDSLDVTQVLIEVDNTGIGCVGFVVREGTPEGELLEVVFKDTGDDEV
jgi:hypothetical protein